MENTVLKKKTRNSSFEILRLAAMLMIIVSHIYAGTQGGEQFSTANKAIYILTNSLFGAGLGVIIFMLLSGYFLIKFSEQKMFKFISMTWVCSVFSLIIAIVFSLITKTPLFSIITKISVLKRFVPLSTNEYWYLSAYVCLLLLSPFINKAINAMSKKSFTILVSIIVFCFFMLPSILYFDIMGDKGKGLITMISCYLIGAYFSKYKINFKKKTLLTALCISYFISTVLNFLSSFFSVKLSSEHGSVAYPFSRECSIFTLVIGISLLLLASGKTFSNKAVNSVSTKTLYIYVIGGQFTALISHFNIVENNQNKLYLVFIVFGLSIAVFAAAYICAVLLEKPIELLSNLLYAIYNKLKQVAIKLYNKNAG